MLKHLSFGAARAALLLTALAAPAAPALAQAYAAPVVEDASAKLARNMRVLGASPKNFTALIGAGRAALELGDTQAAAGFFGRAEEVQPGSPLPKAGMGTAMLAMGDARGALNYFSNAQRLGASQISIAVDRGLAFDLIGDQAKAQSDYRVALMGPDGNEARRRLALSLAISRDIRGAGETLEPLLLRRDRAAMRINAFILALAGDREGARRTIDAAMPGAGARFEPFFKVLPVLGPAEKAAAVHLGEFPRDAAQRYAQAEPIASSPVLSIGNSAQPRTSAVRTASRETPPSRPVKVADAPRRAVREAPKPSTYMSSIRPSLDPSRYASTRRPKTASSASKPQEKAADDPEPRPAGRLDDIAQLLSNSLPPAPEPKYEVVAPPAPQPRVEPAASKPVKLASATPAKDAAKSKAAEKKAADKKAAEKKAAEPVSRHFVQLASGANADRLPGEFKKIRAKKPGLFSGRSAQVSKGKDLFRLVIGPFKTRDASREFVNDLAKAGIDGFSYTAPDGLKFEKIATK